jgi:hypothetical protein
MIIPRKMCLYLESSKYKIYLTNKEQFIASKFSDSFYLNTLPYFMKLKINTQSLEQSLTITTLFSL